MLVRDLMRRSLITCLARTPLAEVARLMVQHKLHAVIVSDPAGLSQGVVSDSALVTAGWLSGGGNPEAAHALTAGQIMQSPPDSIDADAQLVEATARMQSQRLHRLLVTEMGRGVGMLSLSDLIGGLWQAPQPRRSVADAMDWGLVVCRAEASLNAAARAMTEHRLRSVVIVDAQGRPLGMVTGFDLLPVLAGGDAQQRVVEIMHAPLAIGPEATLLEAARRMLEHRAQRLIVTDPANPDGMPLGQISMSDIVAEMALPGTRA